LEYPSQREDNSKRVKKKISTTSKPISTNQTWYRPSLGEGNARLFKYRASCSLQMRDNHGHEKKIGVILKSSDEIIKLSVPESIQT
jgi:hypothetical protein